MSDTGTNSTRSALKGKLKSTASKAVPESVANARKNLQKAQLAAAALTGGTSAAIKLGLDVARKHKKLVFALTITPICCFILLQMLFVSFYLYLWENKAKIAEDIAEAGLDAGACSGKELADALLGPLYDVDFKKCVSLIAEDKLEERFKAFLKDN